MLIVLSSCFDLYLRNFFFPLLLMEPSSSSSVISDSLSVSSLRSCLSSSFCSVVSREKRKEGVGFS